DSGAKVFCCCSMWAPPKTGGYTTPTWGTLDNDEPRNTPLVMAAVDYSTSAQNSFNNNPANTPFDTLPGFRSLHAGGCNFAFCDGSVHFVQSSINQATYEALSTIAGGEVLDASAY